MANVLDGICPDVPLLDFIGQENHWPRSASRKEWLLITCELVASTIYRWMSEGTFPKQIQLGSRSVVWLESDVTKWMEDQIKHS